MAATGAEVAALNVEQIQKEYRTQSRLRHPKNRPDDPNATADFQSCAGSYKLLRDESLCRQFYKVAGRRSLVSGGP
jgi:DnaJ family protein C protein 17